MDLALFREREAFKKRAMAVMPVENRVSSVQRDPLPELPPLDRKESSPPTKTVKPSAVSREPLRYKTLTTGATSTTFSVLARIVKYMKTRHLEGETHPLTLDEILDESSLMNVGIRHKQWLQQEALLSNPRIEVTTDGKFVYKPPYNVRDAKSLLRLLQRHQHRGLGGVFLDDIRESMPDVDAALKKLGDNLLLITRPTDKKVVLFVNDKSTYVPIDEDLIKLWHSISVEGIDDAKIEEYLQRQGIQSMQDSSGKRVTPTVIKRKKGAQKKTHQARRHNKHLSDVLMQFN